MKYLVIFKLNPFSEEAKIQDHTIQADGFEQTDFDIVFWEYWVSGKRNKAVYRMDHLVCVVEMEDK